jgi:hypothetical protein
VYHFVYICIFLCHSMKQVLTGFEEIWSKPANQIQKSQTFLNLNPLLLLFHQWGSQEIILAYFGASMCVGPVKLFVKSWRCHLQWLAMIELRRLAMTCFNSIDLQWLAMTCKILHWLAMICNWNRNLQSKCNNMYENYTIFSNERMTADALMSIDDRIHWISLTFVEFCLYLFDFFVSSGS